VPSVHEPALSGRRSLRGLPIIVGVTGHRDLRAEDLAELERAVGRILDQLRADYPTTPLLALTPLAEGADRLLARVAIARNISYLVPLPLPLAQYCQDFSPASRSEFGELLRGAVGSYAMPFVRDNDPENVAEPDRRAHQYALVGAHIARASHVLIALWDGEQSTAVGGTAEIVRFRCYGVPGHYLHRTSVLDAPETGCVYHVYAPRFAQQDAVVPPGHTQRIVRGGLPTTDAPYALAVLEGEKSDPFEPLYRRIADFNDDCQLIDQAPTSATSFTERRMRMAEAAANHYQRKSRVALDRLFLATGVAALTLAGYSHLYPRKHLLVLPYLAALVIAGLAYLAARRGRWQDRCQDYRALEMGLWVQHVWMRIGLRDSVADYYVRRQRSELDWIREAIRTAHNVDRAVNPTYAFDEADGVAAVRDFVAKQLAYFETASKRESAAANRYKRLATWALGLSFASSVLLIAFGVSMHLWWTFGRASYPTDDVTETAHGVLIFLIAASTILAALLHDYPERRALHQHARRYSVMQAIYQRAIDALDRADQPQQDPDDDAPASRLAVAREVILDIGREAVVENGEWVLLHRELPIELLSV
jgi:hypothetical protein